MPESTVVVTGGPPNFWETVCTPKKAIIWVGVPVSTPSKYPSKLYDGWVSVWISENQLVPTSYEYSQKRLYEYMGGCLIDSKKTSKYPSVSIQQIVWWVGLCKFQKTS